MKQTNMNINNIFSLCFLLLSTILIVSDASNNQGTNLYKLLISKTSKNPSLNTPWAKIPAQLKEEWAHVGPQDGLMENDELNSLPGQPSGIDFQQYSGYVNVDPVAGKALFYYFVESPQNSSTKPLVLWLNGGPGCSSFGNGGMLELGPFRVNRDGKTLFRNKYSWNEVANVIFLESPAGVGFSYANDTSVYSKTGDISTAKDAYTFLLNWFERFPQYKNREFYLTGESYAGHYVPQLAYTILHNNNNNPNGSFINLKGIAIGNAWIDDATSMSGQFDYIWNHAMCSDESHSKLVKFCNFSNHIVSKECLQVVKQIEDEMGDDIDIYNIYAPLCLNNNNNNNNNQSQQLQLQHTPHSLAASVENVDPCSPNYVNSYLNTEDIQKALHAKFTNWTSCSVVLGKWLDSPSTVLPVIQELMASNLSVWIYSGDVDGRVPVTSSKYSINILNLPVKAPWRPWYSNKQVGGYVMEYEGLVFVTIRGAGHMVPRDQPQRALTMISSFLQATLPPIK